MQAPASNRKVPQRGYAVNGRSSASFPEVCRALLGGIYCAVSGKPDALTVPWRVLGQPVQPQADASVSSVRAELRAAHPVCAVDSSPDDFCG